MLNAINYSLLKNISKKFIPVFANEVFVVFSNNRGLPEVAADSPHIISFWHEMKKLKRRLPLLLLKNFFRKFYYRIMPPAVSSEALSAISTKSGGDYSSCSVAEIKRHMDERYEKEEAYTINTLWDKIRAEELNKRVINIISPTNDKKILEVGAGVGGAAAYISECKEFVGTDLSGVAVNQAKKLFGNKPNFSFKTMDAMALEFEDNSFDVVIAKEVIEHLPKPQKAIREAFRVLRKGGLLVVTSPNRNSLHLRVNRMLGYPDFKCSLAISRSSVSKRQSR